MATKPSSAPKYTHLSVPYHAEYPDEPDFASAVPHTNEADAIQQAKVMAANTEDGSSGRAAVFAITNIFGQVTKIDSLWSRPGNS